MIQLKHVEKLCQSQKGLTAAYTASLPLQQRGWVLFPCADWSKPAILAFSGTECIAGINWSVDEDDDSITVRFAWCDSEEPQVLVRLLTWFRDKFSEREVNFTAHPGNEQMMRLVKLMRLQPQSISYRLTL